MRIDCATKKANRNEADWISSEDTQNLRTPDTQGVASQTRQGTIRSRAGGVRGFAPWSQKTELAAAPVASDPRW